MMKVDSKNAGRGFSRDMSPQAISQRLKKVSDLRRICLKLAQAKNSAKCEPQHRQNQ